jgi:hypothetical protein
MVSRTATSYGGARAAIVDVTKSGLPLPNRAAQPHVPLDRGRGPYTQMHTDAVGKRRTTGGSGNIADPRAQTESRISALLRTTLPAVVPCRRLPAGAWYGVRDAV